MSQIENAGKNEMRNSETFYEKKHIFIFHASPITF